MKSVPLWASSSVISIFYLVLDYLFQLGYYDDPLIKYLKRINLYENLCDRDKEEVLSVELPHCAKHLTQVMISSFRTDFCNNEC